MPLLTITQSFWEYLGPVCNACFSMLFILCIFHIMIYYVFLYLLSNHLIIICHHLSRLSRSVSPGPMRMWKKCRPRLGTLAAEGWLLLSLVFTAELPHHVLANVLNTESVWMLSCIVLYFATTQRLFLASILLNKQACTINMKHTVAV